MPSLSAARSSNELYSPGYPPVAVFVGGTSGIGQAMAEGFARYTKGNARIILVDVNENEELRWLRRTRALIPTFLLKSARAKREGGPLSLNVPTSNIFQRMIYLFCLFWCTGSVSLSVDLVLCRRDIYLDAVYFTSQVPSYRGASKVMVKVINQMQMTTKNGRASQ